MVYNKKTLNDVDFNNKVALVRVDFNVPIADGKIVDDTRITSSLKTIEHILQFDSKIVLFSHLGRVKNIDDLEKKSLSVVFDYLKELLPDVNIIFESNNRNPRLKEIIKNAPSKSIILLENTRHNDIDEKGNVVKLESKNDNNLAKFWASLGDVFVNDAFGTSHRSHASNVGICNNSKESCIGFLVENEIEMISKAMQNPESPVIAIFGGAKVKDKIKSIENICKIADKVIIGGGMSYTFQKALGHEIGKSLFDEENFEYAKKLLEKYPNKICLPVDVLASTTFEDVKPTKFKIDSISPEYEGMDIGKKSVKEFTKIIKNAKTILWNGPLGVCEFSNFRNGTKKICKAIAKSTVKNNAFTLIGGGDSIAMVSSLGMTHLFSHISTGGGASITMLEDKVLPGVECVHEKGQSVVEAKQKVETITKTKATPVKKETIKSSSSKKKESSSSAKKVVSKAKVDTKKASKKTSTAKKPTKGKK